ncbi:basic leucine zipper transcriptional factor ATF-like isoform X1 [Pteropus medius]|uniref:basic leucine zipper transcriptional factor ATF-like isoform X1 n=1 Tax=Pteropus vampyrus TaxID=132908 RepID=UPI00196B2D2D|nr:basic leucine zipper transcriptional factor ATF-like isoform X1 [Pteropus giganteus]
MPHSSDSSDSSFSRSPPPGKQDSSDDVRKVQRREKNRIAAQKSRQRQTQKADTLHLHHMVHLHFLPRDEITSEFTQQAWGLQPMQLAFPDFREKLLAATYQSAAIKQRVWLWSEMFISSQTVITYLLYPLAPQLCL